LYVADTRNSVIRKIDINKNVTTFAGSTQGSADGQGTAAQFNIPYGITIDSANNLYVADTDNDRIRKITPSGYVTTIAGLTARSLRTSTIDSYGNLYVGSEDCIIHKLDTSGNVTTIAGAVFSKTSSFVPYADGIGVNARFNGPYGIIADSSGNLYVTDVGNNRIRKITFI
jgi:sugar lactone lactonase YvrE